MGKSFSIVCIGGMNIDRKFYAKSSLQYETSNPVSSSYSVGGVARNIAENLGRLGNHVTLISVSGKDGDWKIIQERSSPYMDLSSVEQREEVSTGSYTAVLDSAGDLAIALADMDVFDLISPSLLRKHEQILLSADCLMIDLNCPLETVDFLLEFGRVRDIPVMVIPVSSPKMDRLPRDLSGLSWLIVNREETEAFFNRPIKNEEDWRTSVESWLQLGIENVIVTNGKKGVMAASGEREPVYFPSVPTPKVVDVTGAGDSFCSAVIHMWLSGYSLEEAVQAGMVNAHRTIMSKYTVRVDLSREQLLKDLEEINGRNF